MTHPKGILGRYGVHPKKSLGQNFLVEASILQRIGDLGALTRIDNVLEIGPGIGSLTKIIAASAGQVVAIELDDRLIAILKDELVGYDNIRLIHGDVLAVGPSELFDLPYKVIANVPYYITGAILQHLLDPPIKPDLMVLTVQKEVADRLTAKPGKMSILSVSVQVHGDINTELIIRAGSFWPKPGIDSAVVRFTLHTDLLIEQSELGAFMKLVRIGFSNKRKQLQKNLRAIIPERDRLQDMFGSVGLDGTRRAQTLSIEEWLALFRSLS
ncbi:MAG: 16S rRNA (adenine(1518)-N(6)/adenine(1519)-N(6))-dimethyltransferase RsmA [Candidatus Promineifilaceae bacterium]